MLPPPPLSDAREQVPALAGGGGGQRQRPGRCERDGDHTGHGGRGGKHGVRRKQPSFPGDVSLYCLCLAQNCCFEVLHHAHVHLHTCRFQGPPAESGVESAGCRQCWEDPFRSEGVLGIVYFLAYLDRFQRCSSVTILFSTQPSLYRLFRAIHFMFRNVSLLETPSHPDHYRNTVSPQCPMALFLAKPAFVPGGRRCLGRDWTQQATASQTRLLTQAWAASTPELPPGLRSVGLALA